jgi:hypothetical protein
MFCAADVNTGLIQLVGPISSPDLSIITVNRSPLMISFGSRTTAPSLVGNRIDESGQNTCTSDYKKYTLADVQIASPVHTGFNLPGNTDTPRAELILSFSADSTQSASAQLSGLLLCLPIYESSSSSHGEYIDQIIKNDPGVAAIPTLETLFYSSDTDTSQTSFRYTTCFETIDERQEIHSNSLLIYVFPNGIKLSTTTYQQLFSLLQQSLSTYQLPPGLRGGDSTIRRYTIDDNGNKKASMIDSDGVIYTTPLSTCTEDFKNRFEYFTKPPSRPQNRSSNTFSSKFASTGQNTCPTVNNYKCVPFDQLQDLNGRYVQVSDGRCLDDIIKSGGTVPSSNSSSTTSTTSSANLSGVSIPSTAPPSMTVADIESIVGAIAAVVVIGGVIVYVVGRVTKSE